MIASNVEIHSRIELAECCSSKSVVSLTFWHVSGRLNAPITSFCVGSTLTDCLCLPLVLGGWDTVTVIIVYKQW